MKPKIIGNKEVKDMFCGKKTKGFKLFYIKIVDGRTGRYIPLNIRSFIQVFIKKEY